MNSTLLHHYFRLLQWDWYLFTTIMDLKFLELELARKAGFNPNQPRVPRGNPEGGQWTRVGGGSGTSAGRFGGRYAPARPAQLVSSRPRGSGRVLVGGRLVEATPAQQARLTVSEARARAAERRVREVDPNWRPTPSLHESVEGAIAANERIVREAEARLAGHGRRVVDSARYANELFLPGGQPVGSRLRGTKERTRTVSKSEMENLISRLNVSDPVSLPGRDYPGQCFRQRDGTVIGVRISRHHGTTIDVIRSADPLLPSGFKVHAR
jgi:hypothetical protein